MERVPKLLLTRNGQTLQSVRVQVPLSRLDALLDVNESQAYGFELENREDNTEYGIWLGDIAAGTCSRPDGRSSSTTGVARSSIVCWDDAFYFEGSRGPVWVRLLSRSQDSDSLWRERVTFQVIVDLGKLSADRYQTMFSQMGMLAAGLVLDLVSKSTRSTKISILPSTPRVRTSAIELRILETAWPTIAASLQRISTSPKTDLRRTITMRNCWGGERFDSQSIVSMTRNGIDPFAMKAALPFKAQISRVNESYDTYEHRVIRAFVELLRERAIECRTNIDKHVEAIELDRKWRGRPNSTGQSLFETEDIPKLKQLRSRRLRANELIKQIESVTSIEPLVGVRPKLNLASSPTFDNVEAYRDVRLQLLRFLKSGLIIIDEGSDERIKSTSRLYEQWVYMQLVAAFREAGLFCSSQRGILHTAKMYRFTLDLDRCARVTFLAGDKRAIVVKYEPWVTPKALAVQNRDSVYRGRHGDVAWSPDILIEFLSGPEEMGEPPSVEYAVVVDSKYSAVIRDHHWEDTSKYLEIRSTASNRQVVRQQWLAFPGNSSQGNYSNIMIRDAEVEWTARGPNIPRDETLQGILSLVPPTALDLEAVMEGWIVRPETSAVEFVRGLLGYMNFA